MREKTGYYDRNGKEIRDGDRLKAIIGCRIYTGYVDERDGDWRLVTKAFELTLRVLDDVEILEDE